MASLVWGIVIRDPVFCEQSATSGGALVADLCVRGVWVPQAAALFDICVVYADAQSYHDHTPMAVLSTGKHDKKQKYSQAQELPSLLCVCVSLYGMIGCEATAILKWIGDMLSAIGKPGNGLRNCNGMGSC